MGMIIWNSFKAIVSRPEIQPMLQALGKTLMLFANILIYSKMSGFNITLFVSRNSLFLKN